MKLEYSDHFLKRLRKRLAKNPQLKPKIAKQLKFLQENPQHPPLKTHKLKGSRAEQYAIWIERDLRITLIIEGETIILTDLITHDEY